ncbi:unnamed protein product [Dicrocoelium dendriticum]|nr:unnamed protein product [Dicrocoelium dendriticum]
MYEMAHDPASPTEQSEDVQILLDLFIISLPSSTPITVSSANVTEIPLPPAAFNALKIPLPNPLADEVHHSLANIPQIILQPLKPDMPEAKPFSGPLNFSFRISSKLFNSDATKEPGIYENSREVKPEESCSIPDLQATMKRSNQLQIPVGVCRPKSKYS